jgi:hypothetical protein
VGTSIMTAWGRWLILGRIWPPVSGPQSHRENTLDSQVREDALLPLPGSQAAPR